MCWQDNAYQAEDVTDVGGVDSKDIGHDQDGHQEADGERNLRKKHNLWRH